MQSIPTLFERDYVGKPTKKNFNAIDTVTEGCEWVQAGEGVATQKHDGTACLIRHGVFYKRLRVKEGHMVPSGWLHWTFDLHQHSGHGWIPVGSGPDDQWHREARHMAARIYGDGTYELCGPHVQGNPEDYAAHVLVRHGNVELENVPTDFDGIREWLSQEDVEGIVWHHPDGRMAKIKKRDFGMARR